jgi:2-phospho-L-lactate/phosphoenolpyruvate guanylyltransferase
MNTAGSAQSAGGAQDESAREVCALVAIKQRERCKMRLATALAPAARLSLVRSMLSAVLAAARDAQMVREVVLVSPERDTVPAGVPVMKDNGASLNEALVQAYATLCERGWRGFVILPADLPRITAGEIDALVRAGRHGGFAIAPDAAGGGTNALYLAGARARASASAAASAGAGASADAAAFRFQFGPASCRLHLREAQRLGLHARVVRLPGLAFDVDTPADVAQLKPADLSRLNGDAASDDLSEPRPWHASLRA